MFCLYRFFHWSHVCSMGRFNSLVAFPISMCSIPSACITFSCYITFSFKCLPSSLSPVFLCSCPHNVMRQWQLIGGGGLVWQHISGLKRVRKKRGSNNTKYLQPSSFYLLRPQLLSLSPPPECPAVNSC